MIFLGGYVYCFLDAPKKYAILVEKYARLQEKYARFFYQFKYKIYILIKLN